MDGAHSVARKEDERRDPKKEPTGSSSTKPVTPNKEVKVFLEAPREENPRSEKHVLEGCDVKQTHSIRNAASPIPGSVSPIPSHPVPGLYKLSSTPTKNTSGAVSPLNIPLEETSQIHADAAASLFHGNIVKAKRLLSSMQQFAYNLSSEIGDAIKGHILNLICNEITIEEFHHHLQETMNFPLRPFVLPFLKTYIPFVQKEINVQAKISKQVTRQFVKQNESSFSDPLYSAGDMFEIFYQPESLIVPRIEITGSKKRQASDISGPSTAAAESSMELHSPPNKRQHLMANLVSAQLHKQQQPFYSYPTEYFHTTPPPNSWTATNSAPSTPNGDNRKGNMDVESEWNNITVMLNCILSMVDKTKRALAMLQERTSQSAPYMDPMNENAAERNGRQVICEELKRKASELVGQTVRLTEERVAQIKRRADDAINEVKKQAIQELTKIVSTVENSLVASEVGSAVSNLTRLTLNTTATNLSVPEVQKSTRQLEITFALECRGDGGNDSLNPFHRHPNNCLNCGRKALDTCSGCRTARYCNSFCQQKDWDSHHSACGNPYLPIDKSNSANIKSYYSSNVIDLVNRSTTNESVRSESFRLYQSNQNERHQNYAPGGQLPLVQKPPYLTKNKKN